ncbi:MAG: hypothetical protein M1830_003501 [Pleopsidium flavum]|nr:MAG: hypothetical protein M1830_003501 [Pleopsidium flavum]
MEKFQRAGVHAYDQIVKQLRALDVIPSFMTPKHKIIVLDEDAPKADCAILILDAVTSVPTPDPSGDDGLKLRN